MAKSKPAKKLVVNARKHTPKGKAIKVNVDDLKFGKQLTLN